MCVSEYYKSAGWPEDVALIEFSNHLHSFGDKLAEKKERFEAWYFNEFPYVSTAYLPSIDFECHLSWEQYARVNLE